MFYFFNACKSLSPVHTQLITFFTVLLCKFTFFSDSSDLELLLGHFVKDPEGLRLIGNKLSEVRRVHDEKLESLMAQNRILHQEIVYLRNRQNSSNVSSSVISP